MTTPAEPEQREHCDKHDPENEFVSIADLKHAFRGQNSLRLYSSGYCVCAIHELLLEEGKIQQHPHPPKMASGKEYFRLTQEELTELYYADAGVSPVEPYNPDDNTYYPIPEAKPILDRIRDRGVCASESGQKDEHDKRPRPPCEECIYQKERRTWESCRQHFSCPDGEECWYLSEDYHREHDERVRKEERERVLKEVRYDFMNDETLHQNIKFRLSWKLDKIERGEPK